MGKRRGAGRTAPLALIFGLILALSGCDDQVVAAKRDVAGQKARELVAVTVDDQAVRLADYPNQVVVVNFWLAECGPCLAEMPDFDAFYKEYRDKGVMVLAVNIGQGADAVKETRRRLGVSFPLALDPLKITAERYNVLAVPTSFVIDRNGVLVERINGPLNQAALIRKTEPLL